MALISGALMAASAVRAGEPPVCVKQRYFNWSACSGVKVLPHARGVEISAPGKVDLATGRVEATLGRRRTLVCQNTMVAWDKRANPWSRGVLLKVPTVRGEIHLDRNGGGENCIAGPRDVSLCGGVPDPSVSVDLRFTGPCQVLEPDGGVLLGF